MLRAGPLEKEIPRGKVDRRRVSGQRGFRGDRDVWGLREGGVC